MFSVVLKGRTAGRQRNPVININTLLSHKYFSGCYGCVHFLKDQQLSLLKLPGCSFPARGFLPALGAGNQRETTERKKMRQKLRTADDGGSKPAG